MPADIIDLSEYKKKIELKELEKLKSEVEAAIAGLPVEDSNGYYNYNIESDNMFAYCPGTGMEYIYEQSSCPSCGREYEEDAE